MKMRKGNKTYSVHYIKHMLHKKRKIIIAISIIIYLISLVITIAITYNIDAIPIINKH